MPRMSTVWPLSRVPYGGSNAVDRPMWQFAFCRLVSVNELAKDGAVAMIEIRVGLGIPPVTGTNSWICALVIRTYPLTVIVVTIMMVSHRKLSDLPSEGSLPFSLAGRSWPPFSGGGFSRSSLCWVYIPALSHRRASFAVSESYSLLRRKRTYLV